LKSIIFTILTLIPLTVFCQSIDTIKVNSNQIKKLCIGLNFSPDYCYRTLKTDISHQWIADIRESLEIPKFGFTTGVGLIYILSNRINLETALLFSDKGYKTRKTDLIWSEPDPSLPIKITFIYSYQYLDIPLKANYNIINSKLKLFLSAGVSANIFLTYKQTSIQEFSDGRTEKHTSGSIYNNFSKVNFALLAGLGIDYDLNNKIRFRLEPIYRRSINSIIDAPIKSYLYSAGLNAGIYYKLSN